MPGMGRMDRCCGLESPKMLLSVRSCRANEPGSSGTVSVLHTSYPAATPSSGEMQIMKRSISVLIFQVTKSRVKLGGLLVQLQANHAAGHRLKREGGGRWLVT